MVNPINTFASGKLPNLEPISRSGLQNFGVTGFKSSQINNFGGNQMARTGFGSSMAFKGVNVLKDSKKIGNFANSDRLLSGVNRNFGASKKLGKKLPYPNLVIFADYFIQNFF